MYMYASTPLLKAHRCTWWKVWEFHRSCQRLPLNSFREVWRLLVLANVPDFLPFCGVMHLAPTAVIIKAFLHRVAISAQHG